MIGRLQRSGGVNPALRAPLAVQDRPGQVFGGRVRACGRGGGIGRAAPVVTTGPGGRRGSMTHEAAEGLARLDAPGVGGAQHRRDDGRMFGNMRSPGMMAPLKPMAGDLWGR